MKRAPERYRLLDPESSVLPLDHRGLPPTSLEKNIAVYFVAIVILGVQWKQIKAS